MVRERAGEIATYSERAAWKGNFPLDTYNDGLLMLRPLTVHWGAAARAPAAEDRRRTSGPNSADCTARANHIHTGDQGERDGQTAQSTGLSSDRGRRWRSHRFSGNPSFPALMGAGQEGARR